MATVQIQEPQRLLIGSPARSALSRHPPEERLRLRDNSRG
jgi:hypothetical protein